MPTLHYITLEVLCVWGQHKPKSIEASVSFVFRDLQSNAFLTDLVIVCAHKVTLVSVVKGLRFWVWSLHRPTMRWNEARLSFNTTKSAAVLGIYLRGFTKQQDSDFDWLRCLSPCAISGMDHLHNLIFSYPNCGRDCQWSFLHTEGLWESLQMTLSPKPTLTGEQSASKIAASEACTCWCT